MLNERRRQLLGIVIQASRGRYAHQTVVTSERCLRHGYHGASKNGDEGEKNTPVNKSKNTKDSPAWKCYSFTTDCLLQCRRRRLLPYTSRKSHASLHFHSLRSFLFTKTNQIAHRRINVSYTVYVYIHIIYIIQIFIFIANLYFTWIYICLGGFFSLQSEKKPNNNKKNPSRLKRLKV